MVIPHSFMANKKKKKKRHRRQRCRQKTLATSGKVCNTFSDLVYYQAGFSLKKKKEKEKKRKEGKEKKRFTFEEKRESDPMKAGSAKHTFAGLLLLLLLLFGLGVVVLRKKIKQSPTRASRERRSTAARTLHK